MSAYSGGDRPQGFVRNIDGLGRDADRAIGDPTRQSENPGWAERTWHNPLVANATRNNSWWNPMLYLKGGGMIVVKTALFGLACLADCMLGPSRIIRKGESLDNRYDGPR